jgi:hypothetical protein
MRKMIIKGIALFLFFLSFCVKAGSEEISLSPQETMRIAEKIFENECSSKNECLVEWNEGEDFLSLGIGHFIWYPRDQSGPFEESFLKFLSYAKASGEKIPDWLNTTFFPACPWNSREDFLNNQEDTRLLKLREFLIMTKPRQAAFIVDRLKDALPQMLNSVAVENQTKITKQFYRMTSTPAGIYALVDYINFKGLGIFASERYQGGGWGLLQVLSEMNGENNGIQAVEEFVRVAKKILARRVANSPQGRNEQKWLSGWQHRIDSYLEGSILIEPSL